ncbi:hypothetical protein B484DRAFT_282279, partial [Ochromonadaceae sp. CCMP2298]
MPSRPSVSSIPIGLILKNAFSKRTEEDEDMSELNGGVDIDMGVGEHTLGQSVGVGMGMGMGMGLGDMGQNARVNVRINNLGINHSFAPTYRMGNSSNSMDSGSTSNGSSRSSLHSSTHNLHNLHNLDPLGLSMSRGDSHLDDLRLDLDVDGGDVACIDPLAMFDFGTYYMYCVGSYYVLCTAYCALCTVYCALCTVHCVLCTVYCALCTVHCVLCTV